MKLRQTQSGTGGGIKPSASSPRRLRASGGFTLIECLIYMSVLFVIMGVGYVAMYRSMDASAGFRRNGTDISQALKAGERWRADVRNAAASLRVETTRDGDTILHVPQAHGQIDYLITSNSVSRRIGKKDWVPILEHVKTASFVADRREKVTAWRWEIELQVYRKQVGRLRPLFTFIAVPAKLSTQ